MAPGRLSNIWLDPTGEAPAGGASANELALARAADGDVLYSV